MGSAPNQRQDILSDLAALGALPGTPSLRVRPIYPWCFATEFVMRMPGLPEKRSLMHSRVEAATIKGAAERAYFERSSDCSF